MYKRNSSKKKTLLICTAIVVVVVGLLTLGNLRGLTNIPFLPQKKNVNTDSVTSDINYGPPTEEEKKETEAFKDKQANDSTPPTTSTKTVTPVITSWGTNPQTGDVEISALVPGITENGGTCTAILQKGEIKVQRSSSAVGDAQSTSCTTITVPRSALSAGTWNIKVDYSSSTAKGSSNQSISQEVK